MVKFPVLFLLAVVLLFSCDNGNDTPPFFSTTYTIDDSSLGKVPVDTTGPYTEGSIVTVLNIAEIYTDELFFAGWSDGENSYYPNDTFIMGTEDVELKAQWAEKKVEDIDGNSYNTIKTGNQIWMAENLKTITLNDGSPIQKAEENSVWESMTAPAYCWYSNDSVAYNDYGLLYNGYTINTDKLCPVGWHVPSTEDWEDLASYLGGNEIAGGKLKEQDFEHWKQPNTGATNETGFTALPGGNRTESGFFQFGADLGFWWCTVYEDELANYHLFSNSSILSNSAAGLKDGLSVRCIKD